MTASKGSLQQRVKMEAGLCEFFVNFKMPTTALTHFRYCNECTQEEQKETGGSTIKMRELWQHSPNLGRDYWQHMLKEAVQ